MYTVWHCFRVLKQISLPISWRPRIIGHVILVNPVVIVPYEALLLAECPNGASAIDCFEEVIEDRRSTHWLDSL